MSAPGLCRSIAALLGGIASWAGVCRPTLADDADALANPVSSLIGNQRVSYGGGVRYYFTSPAGGPDWGPRLTLTFLYPE